MKTHGEVIAIPGEAERLRQEAYDAWLARQELFGEHEAHRRQKNTVKLMARCVSCGEQRIRWGLTQPESSHVGRNMRRLAAQFGVEL